MKVNPNVTAVGTYSFSLKNAQDHIDHTCEFCPRDVVATHWSQRATSQGGRAGRVVYHCQMHTGLARSIAQGVKVLDTGPAWQTSEGYQALLTNILNRAKINL